MNDEELVLNNKKFQKEDMIILSIYPEGTETDGILNGFLYVKVSLRDEVLVEASCWYPEISCKVIKNLQELAKKKSLTEKEQFLFSYFRDVVWAALLSANLNRLDDARPLTKFLVSRMHNQKINYIKLTELVSLFRESSFYKGEDVLTLDNVKEIINNQIEKHHLKLVLRIIDNHLFCSSGLSSCFYIPLTE